MAQNAPGLALCQWLECHSHCFCLLQKLSIKSNTLSQEFEQYFGPRNKLILKMVGSCCDRGMLNLQIDWYIFMYHTQPMKCDQILSILTERAYILIHSFLLAHNTEHPFVHQWFIFLILTISTVCENISVQTFLTPYAADSIESWEKVSEFSFKYFFYTI